MVPMADLELSCWRDKTPLLVDMFRYHVSTMKPAYDQAATIFRQHGGILRMSEALAAGISRRTLYAMRDDGILDVLSRGVYRLASLPGLEQPDLVTVATRIPRGVICLISALAFHELTTQIPHSIDVALVMGSERPRIDYPPVSVFWFSGEAFTSGIETHRFDGTEVRIYGAEKSIADAFKYRNKLGLDTALEALRTWRSRRGVKTERLLQFARICRVERVMRPYLEAMS
jgi:predicted transcriptional regulator of viral defense system